MASISRSANGRRVIQFKGLDGKRKTLRLGKCDRKTAEGAKTKIEALIAAARVGQSIDDDTADWLRKVDDYMAKRLAEFGLMAPRPAQVKARTLGPFIDDYLADRQAEMKERTMLNARVDSASLVDYFGADRPLDTVTPGDAEDFKIWLGTKGRKIRGAEGQPVDSGFAKATIGRRIRRCSQFFRAALKHRLIRENPFEGIKAPPQVNDARKHFVSVQDAAKLLEACPDMDWRLIIALARFGGVRTPSETLALKWDDVDFVKGRILIRSPKTEHCEGKATREIPLFPELRPYLEEAFDPFETYVVNRYRDATANLRTQFLRIIKRAGLKPWPRVFHNLRASRQTELMEKFPVHVVCAWIGNSALIAGKHYLSVLDSDFNTARALQNALHAAEGVKPHDAAGSADVVPRNAKSRITCGDLQLVAASCGDDGIPPRGFEPLS